MLVVRRVFEEQRLSGGRNAAGQSDPDLRREQVHRGRVERRRESTDERDRTDVVSLDDEHATVVVIDERAKLVRDHR